MPSVVIPFGSPDDAIFTDPTTGATAYFLGNRNFGVDYTAVIDANSSLNATDALSTDDTETFAAADVAGFRADMDATYGNEFADERYLSVKARADFSYSLPENLTSPAVKVIVVARSNWEHSLTPTLYLHDETGAIAGAYVGSSWRMSPAWLRAEGGLSGAFGPGFFALLRAALTDRRATLVIDPSGWTNNVTPLGIYDVSYAALRITWESTIAPPLRQYPRSDGLAASSARRMWPPSRSYQRSNRRAGGYL